MFVRQTSKLRNQPPSSLMYHLHRWGMVPRNSYRWFSSKPFDKLLIANRGEIACRVIRTCQRLGIETVAIYSNADGIHSLHASMADEAYCIGSGPTAGESYLRGEEILEVAQKSGAQAIHPGYGFLSENADFCRKITGNGITFVGPSPEAILAMGSKSYSKSIMEDANVPTTPGYHGSNQDSDFLLHEAVTNVGFPLLIKAVMGGGGKGIRLVWNQKDFLPALESCKRESMAAFGDVGVLLEKYLVNPRHVEVQIIADTHGNVVHLFERDCSLQRRHQKVIEEAPASDLPTEIRHKLGEMGKKAATAVNYVNAGTVEFLLDTQSDNKEFYFCEMNTRLQVEHPVTEMITSIDLVEWQLRVAAGEELPIKNQRDIIACGHAFEARIYAEKGIDFIPAAGTIWHHGPPTVPNTGNSNVKVRVDTGIQTGDEIGVYYDPMISKLITYGVDRKDALDTMFNALKNYHLAGVTTNIEFLLKCVEHPMFQKPGAINTGFIDNYMNELKLDVSTESPCNTALAAFVILLHLENRMGVRDLNDARRTAGTPWSSFAGSWRMGGSNNRARRVLRLLKGSHETHVVECISNVNGSATVVVRDEHGMNFDSFEIEGSLGTDGLLVVLVNGTQHVKSLAKLKENMNDGTISVMCWSQNQVDGKYSSSTSFKHPMVSQILVCDEQAITGYGTVKAPMPGRIVRINFRDGDLVKKDEPVVVMEAMKMEHTIKAPKGGIVQGLSFHRVNDIIKDSTTLFLVGENVAPPNTP